MTTSSAVRPRTRSSTVGPAVWDNLWERQLSTEKEDAVLLRERRSPRWAYVVQAVEEAFGSLAGLRTIELGCGRGDFSALMAERGATVTLLDYSDAALDRARRRFQRLGLQARYLRADFLNDVNDLAGQFDVSMSLGVIEHFRGAVRTRSIRAHRHFLRDGGMVVIGAPHAACPPYRLWKMLLEIPQWWPYGLEIPYSRPELARRARAAGLVSIAIRCTGLWQAIGDYWLKGIVGRGPDWVARRSFLDRFIGTNLLLMARTNGSAGGAS